MAGPRGHRRRVVLVSSARSAHHPRFHYRLAAALQEAGYEAIVLSQPLAGPPQRDAVPVEYLPLQPNRLFRMALAPIAMSRALRRDADAVHVLTLDLLPWAVVAKLLGCGTILYESNDEHDSMMLIKEWIPVPLRRPLRNLFHWLEPWLARRLDAATTALPATQAKFEQAGVRSVLVRNFPPLDWVTSSGRGPEFGYDVLVGGSLPSYQIPVLAAMARRLEERRETPVRWLVAARNYGSRERDLLEHALDNAGVRQRFDLRYNLPFAEMRELMAASRVGLVLYPASLNYQSRIPIRIFEYMAVGMPFVASDLPTISEFAGGRGVAQLAPAGEPAGLADALSSLLDDPNRQREMSARGPELVRTDYNWERESQKLVELYRELIGDPA
jgi:glycosyltransferase involved in cell wall biosynthesis